MDQNPERNGPRGGRLRDRRGRNRRTPLALPGPLTPDGVPAALTPTEEFDEAVVAVIERIRGRFPEAMARVDVGVEDQPILPDDWDQRVPAATRIAESSAKRARIVLFRRPLTTRARSRAELDGLILATVAEQLAALWDTDPDEIDPLL